MLVFGPWIGNYKDITLIRKITELLLTEDIFYEKAIDCVQWSREPQSEGIVSFLGLGFIQACVPTMKDFF